MSTVENVCNLCNLPAGEEDEMGPLAQHGEVFAHVNCMYFSSDMQQKTRNNSGTLYGFRKLDIMMVANRHRRTMCCYCGKKGAHIKCHRSKCNRYYHFHCGVVNHVTYEFCETYKTFCGQHRVHVGRLNMGKKKVAGERCACCLEDINAEDSRLNYFRPVCCGGMYVHVKCAKLVALNAGVFTKCPGCNSTVPFVEQLQQIGVRVPHSDARWEVCDENDEQRYADLYEREAACTRAECLAPDGRHQDDEPRSWRIVYCDVCGGNELHKGCIYPPQRRYRCAVCTPVLGSGSVVKKKARRSKPAITTPLPVTEASPEDVSLCKRKVPRVILTKYTYPNHYTF